MITPRSPSRDWIRSHDFSAGGDDDDLATDQAAKNLKINKLKKKKASKKSNKTVINLIDNVIEEDEKSKSSKISQKSADQKSRSSKNSGNGSQNLIQNEDLNEINNEMKPVDGWGFEAVKLPARKSVA